MNNERNLYQQSSSLRGTPLRNSENGSGVNSLQLANATNSSNQVSCYCILGPLREYVGPVAKLQLEPL